MDSVRRQLSDVVQAFYEEGNANQWDLSYSESMVLITRAKVAVERAFPAAHSYTTAISWLLSECQQMEYDSLPYGHLASHFSHAHGITEAALHDYSNGYLQSVSRAVELRTVEDVLDQAQVLVSDGFLPAAAVLAGGALETHLKALVEDAGLKVKGAGSLAAYNRAIREQERSGSAALYDKEAAKEVEALAGLRNEAAHSPSKFDQKRSKEAVALMIERVRLFIRAHS